MKPIYSYYVTYVLKDFKTDPFGFRSTLLGLDMSKLIIGINISISTFKLFDKYRLLENEDGTFTIDEALIKHEVCDAIWDKVYAVEFKKRSLSDEQFNEKKTETLKRLYNDIVIIAWSETNLSGRLYSTRAKENNKKRKENENG